MRPNNDAVGPSASARVGSSRRPPAPRCGSISAASIKRPSSASAVSSTGRAGPSSTFGRRRRGGRGGWELALWLSGPKALFDEHQPIFKAMGKSVLHVGELGNAKLVKNAMAMLAAVQHLSFVEDRPLAQEGRSRRGHLPEHVSKNSQQEVATRRIMEILVSRKYKPRKSWMPKDVGFGLDMARDMGVPMPFVGLAYQMFAIAQATGQDGYEATGIACNVIDVINGKELSPAEGGHRSRHRRCRSRANNGSARRGYTRSGFSNRNRQSQTVAHLAIRSCPPAFASVAPRWRLHRSSSPGHPAPSTTP